MSEPKRVLEGKRAKVLVVDDYPDGVELLELVLTGEGFEVITACNGVECIQKAREESPDLIVLNYMMPVMDGFTACRELKDTPATRDIPVIIYSGCADEETRRTALSVGACDFFCSPYGRREVLARVHSVLGIEEGGRG